MLDVQLVKCHGKDYCKSQEQITEFMRDKFLYTLSNQVRFDSRNSGSQSIIREARSWYTMINT